MIDNPKDVKQIDTEWTAMFHKVVDEILAPRGYVDHHSGKRVAKLEYLTEDRIKKVANATKRVMDLYIGRMENDLSTSIYNLTYENERILIEINKEKDKWFWERDNYKIADLENDHFTNGTLLRMIPEFLKSLHKVTPHP